MPLGFVDGTFDRRALLWTTGIQALTKESIHTFAL